MRTKTLCLGSLFFAFAVSAVLAADSTPPAGVSAEAYAALSGMSEKMQKAQSMTVGIDRVWRITAKGLLVQHTAQFNVAMKRPNHFSMKFVDGFPATSNAYDGQNLVTYNPMMGKARSQEVPSDAGFKELEAQLGGDDPDNMTMLFILSLFSESPRDSLLEGIKAVTIGENGMIQIKQEDMTWQLLLASDTSLPAKATFQTNEAGLSMGKVADSQFKSEWEITFTNWKLDEATGDEVFKIEQASEPGVMLSADDLERPKHPLEGQMAPQFKLPLLGGGTLDLSKHKGKDIVILDFWASWCGPCRIGMPIIEQISKDYAKKNVVVYAINQQEDEETIRSFLDETGLDLKVAMDKDLKVSMQYGAERIPQTVIVGKDGKAEIVHLGISPTFESDLRRELDALIEGKQE